jgi:PAS domain S-box-containing protein
MFSLSHFAISLAIGVCLYIGLIHFFFWRRERGSHGWVAVWSLFAVMVLAGRLIQYSAQDLSDALIGTRILVGGAPLLIWSLACFGRSLGGEPTPRALGGAFFGASLALALAIGLSPWFFQEALTLRVDTFGREHLSVRARPTVLLLFPFIAGSLVSLARDIKRAPDLVPAERRVLFGALLVYGAMGIGSVLSGMGWVSIPGTVEYGPFVLSIALGDLLVRRHERRDHQLREQMTAQRIELSEAEQHYRSVAEHAPVGIFTCDAQGTLTMANPRLLEMLGAPSVEEVLGIDMLTAPAMRACGADLTLQRCLKTGQAVSGDHHQSSKWGREAEVHLIAAPIRGDDGAVNGLVALTEDVGKRRALEQRLRQSQKMESVGQLAAGIAHEINNPMAYVHSNLGVLRKQWEGLRSMLEEHRDPGLRAQLDDCAELIDESQEGVNRTVGIVRDMRELAHAGPDGREPTDVNRLVEACVRVASTHRRGASHIEERYGEIPPVVGSPGQLRQVFLNLLVNALQAVGVGGRVEVETGTNGKSLWVRIRDDGPGVPVEAQDRLFDPFFTTKPAGQGTGLGLYISYEIVQAHGGEISLTSTPGAGSCFEVRLPAAADSGIEMPPPADTAGDPAPGR